MSIVEVQRDERFPVDPAAEAWIEFAYPKPGGRLLACRLVDVSVAGIRFVLDEDLPLVARGAQIDRALLRVGSHELRASFVVKHLTRMRPNGAVCGAVLYPETDEDLEALNRLIGELRDGV